MLFSVVLQMEGMWLHYCGLGVPQRFTFVYFFVIDLLRSAADRITVR